MKYLLPQNISTEAYSGVRFRLLETVSQIGIINSISELQCVYFVKGNQKAQARPSEDRLEWVTDIVNEWDSLELIVNGYVVPYRWTHYVRL